MAALFDPSCAEAYGEVFADEHDTDWCCLTYEGRKLKCNAKGAGGLAELQNTFDDGLVQYALLRMIKMDDGGDSKRVKFVFIVWVGENAPAMKKGSVTSHKPMVGDLFKGHHVSQSVMERSELATLGDDIMAALVKAGGANYDLGNIRSGVQAGATASIKTSSKAFFQQKDAETEVKDITFAKTIRAGREISACDLSNRAMTVSAAEARRNTVGYSARGEALEPRPAPATAPEPVPVSSTAPAPAPATEEPSQVAAEEEKAEKEENESKGVQIMPEVTTKADAATVDAGAATATEE